MSTALAACAALLPVTLVVAVVQACLNHRTERAAWWRGVASGAAVTASALAMAHLATTITP